MSRILKIAAAAALLSGLAGCAVVPAPVAWVGPSVAVGVAVRPAPYYSAPYYSSPYYATPYYGSRPYNRGYGHGHGYRHW
jgi:hypothetical protein